MRKINLAYFLTFTAVLVCIKLSFWQYQRFIEKKTYLKNIIASEHLSPLKVLPKNLSKQYDARKFILKIHPKNKLILLRDNIYKNKLRGFDVYFPTEINGIWYMVKYAWIKKPLIHIPEKLEISGRIHCPKGREFILKKILPKASYPKIIQRFDISDISKIYQRPIASCILDITDYKPKNNMISPKRHIGYSIQWLLFAILIMYIFYKTNRDSA